MNKTRRAVYLGMTIAATASAAIILPSTVTISGSVYTDPYPLKIASTSIADVRVYLEQQLLVPNTTAQAAVPAYKVLDSVSTDANGHFVLKPEAPGSYNLSFSHPGYASIVTGVYSTKDTSVRVVMVSSIARGSVAGKVLAGCNQSVLGLPCVPAPIPHCTVSVSTGTVFYPLSNQSAVIYPPIALLAYTAVTDDSGNYSIDSIPISANNTRVTVTASKNGFVSQSVDTGLWNSTATVVNFALAPNPASTGGDSVYTIPAKPTTNDSITYNFRDSDACCCAVFENPAVSVQDSAVVLSFSLNSSACQACLCVAAGGKSYAFKGGKLPAGHYGIYRQESPYCPPGQPCPLYVLLPVKIGEVVVTNATSVMPEQPKAMPANGLSISLVKRSINLQYAQKYSGRIGVSMFNARGILAGELFNGQMPAGMHNFAWTAAAPGIYFVSVKMNSVVVAAQKVIVSQ
jgi:hypothetical protein